MDHSTHTGYPWQKIGVPISGLLTVAEAMKFGNCDFTAKKVPFVSAPDDDHDLFGIKAPDKFMVLDATNKYYMGVVGDRYVIVQPVDGFGFFDNALGEASACIEAVGRVGKHSQRIFMVARIPDMVEITPGDPLERHILLTNTFDGSGKLEARFVNWHPGLGVAVNVAGPQVGADRVQIMHTKNATVHLEEAHRVLNKNQQYWDRAIRAYRYLAKRSITEEHTRKLVEHLFPDIVKTDDEGNEIRRTSNQAQRKRDLVKERLAETEARESGLGLYYAVCSFVDKDWKLNKRQKANGESNWTISTFGNGEKLRAKAWRWLLDSNNL